MTTVDDLNKSSPVCRLNHVIPPASQNFLRQLCGDDFKEDENYPRSGQESPPIQYLEEVLADTMGLIEAEAVLLTLYDAKTGRHYSWTLPDQDPTAIPRIREKDLTKSGSRDLEFAAYLRAGTKTHCFTNTPDGQRLRKVTLPREALPVWEGPFKMILTGRLNFGARWRGQLTVARSSMPRGRSHALRLLRQLVTLAEHSYKLHSTESAQIATRERERVARDLHDGVTQTLSAAEMHIELSRRSAQNTSYVDVDAILADAQKALRQSLRTLRVQIEELRSGCYSSDLEPCLTEILRRFEADTRISTQFFCDIEAASVSPADALDLIYIFGEALSNVRKHSHATKVEIHLTGGHQLKLILQNNGHGFDFTGSLSLADLQERKIGPRMICERVQSIGGTLFLESFPQAGSRMEIILPLAGSILSTDNGPLYATPDSDNCFWSPKVPQGSRMARWPRSVRRA